MNNPAAVYVVGVDAGATQTRVLLSDPDQRVVGVDVTSPFSLRHHPAENIRDLISDSLKRLIPLEKQSDVRIGAIAVGAAGVATSDEREKVHKAVHSRFNRSHIYIHHDAYIAHYGAFAGGPGVMVTAGTGSIAYGRNDEGEEARIGGWGWLLGDEGSGWWIAREAVRAALAQWEGSGPETRITELLIETFDLPDAYSLVPKLYADQIERADLIPLAEQVATLAVEGDSVATEIFRHSGKELATLALRTAKRLHIPAAELHVAIVGGVGTGARELLVPGMVAAWESDSAESGSPSIVEPAMDAVEGAVHWCRDMLIKRSYA